MVAVSNKYLEVLQFHTCIMDDPLDLVLDSDNSRGVSRHLGEIANQMSEWEGPIAECLGLNPPEIASIKTKYPANLQLQK